MTEIQLYNTRTRKKERFEPLEPGRVGMYVCGPTVYDRAHIGNARPVVVFDVLYRLMRHVYGDDAVTYVRNFTDVDDKIIARAQETLGEGETLEAACHRITEETIEWYRDDMKALGALPPTKEPRCTEYVPQMVTMIERLIERGCAYEAEGHVLFDVATYPDYGKLARRSLEDMQAGARVEVAPYKRNPMDFVLWKPSTPEQPGWDSPWGRGRPGWHIECSAMSEALLGETFDIHAGGIDLMFPHHENEAAQSCCANQTQVMANFWLHNGFLQVEGDKMAKSLGNFFTVKDLLDKGVPGEVIRFVLLSTHYRAPLDWTEVAQVEAQETLKRWDEILASLGREYWQKNESPRPSPAVVQYLCDDLNTAAAFASIHALAKDARNSQLNSNERRNSQIALHGSLALLGFDPRNHEDLWTAISNNERRARALYPDMKRPEYEYKIDKLLEERVIAKKAKNYARADEIREGLKQAGVVVRDTPQGVEYDLTSDFDPDKLPELSDV